MKDELNKLKNIIDEDLKKRINFKYDYIDKLVESIKYSLFTGGKRLRPIFGIKAFELFDSDIDKYLVYASAVEMIHTYSLIHDDLPAMDDDDYRRGMRTNHIVFGEDMAILAGDALLNLAFEIILNEENLENLEDYKRNRRAMKEIAKYSGSRGMIGGQVIDLNSSLENTNREKLLRMYSCKTAGLFQAAIVSGAIIGGASKKEIEVLREYALFLGISYQIQDDILDMDEDEEINKLTYLSYYSKEEAINDMKSYTNRCMNLLDKLESRDVQFLKSLTKLLVDRNI